MKEDNRQLFQEILIIGSLIWIGYILINFLNPNTHHWYVSVISNILRFSLFPILLTIIAWSILKYKKFLLNNRIVFKIKIWQLILWALAFIVTGYIITGLNRQVITVGNIIPAFGNIIAKYGVVILWLVTLTTVLYLLGQRLLSLIKSPFPDRLSETLFSLGCGYVGLSFSLLALSLLGRLNSWGLTILIVVIVLAGKPYWKNLLGIFKSELSINTSLSSWECWWGWILSLFILLNFSIALIPFPDGWDSLTFYFNLVKELVLTGTYVKGQYFYPIELIWSGAEIFSRTIQASALAEMVAIQTATYGGMLGILAIFNLGKLLKNTAVGILAGLLFVSMPMIGFFSTLEPKVEVSLVFFIALSLTAFFLWRQNRDEKWLIILAFLASYAFLVKITAGFLLVALVVIWLADWIWYQEKQQRIRSLRGVCMAIGVALIILLPWFGLHIWEKGGSFSSPVSLATGRDSMLTKRGNLISRVHLPGIVPISATGYQEDYGRYLGPLTGWWGLEKYLPKNLASIPMARYVSMPWAATMLSYRNDMNMTISSLFLAVLPVVLVWWFVTKRKEKSSNKEGRLLTLFTVAYIIVWIIYGQGTTWYGIGMLIGLVVLTGIVVTGKNLLPTLLQRIILVLVTAEMVFFLLIQVSRFGVPVYLQFVFGRLTRDQAEQKLLPSYQASTKTITSDPVIASGKGYVLAVSTFLPHFLPNYRHILIEDSYLDQFTTLYLALDKDDDRTLAALKQAGIRYIMIETNIVYTDQTKERTLQQKMLQFMNFASKKLILLQGDPNKGTLFLQIPE